MKIFINELPSPEFCYQFFMVCLGHGSYTFLGYELHQVVKLYKGL